MIATIELSFISSSLAERTLQVILPDNTPLPSGLSIECQRRDTQLLITIKCDRIIDSLGATIEDILSAIDLSLRTADTADTTTM
ncbi:MAG: hypothetical protein JW779_09815 [Candidatus Thorarchaeota archaeon]|nr:hypothetical protein [Candidatus Thorarchaeota archaeon]